MFFMSGKYDFSCFRFESSFFRGKSDNLLGLNFQILDVSQSLSSLGPYALEFDENEKGNLNKLFMIYLHIFHLFNILELIVSFF